MCVLCFSSIREPASPSKLGRQPEMFKTSQYIRLKWKIVSQPVVTLSNLKIVPKILSNKIATAFLANANRTKTMRDTFRLNPGKSFVYLWRIVNVLLIALKLNEPNYFLIKWNLHHYAIVVGPHNAIRPLFAIANYFSTL